MTEIIPFFIVLFVGLFFSELFFRFHFPWVITLLLGGVLVGPHGLGILEINETISFLGEIGLVFLMFMAGLETNLLKHGQHKKIKKVIPIAVFNGMIPFAIGFLITNSFGYDLTTALLVGTIFVSSSLAVIIPSLEVVKILKTDLGQMILATAVIVDIASLILLSIFLQTSTPANIPLPLFYLLLLLVLVLFRYLMPKIRWFFENEAKREETDIFQQELRSIFVILIGTVVVFGLIGVDPIVSGFFIGMILSDSVTSKILKAKIHGIGYGIFVPTFFIVTGAQTDFSLLFKIENALIFALLITFGSIFVKFSSGYIGSVFSKLSHKESLIFGSATIPQLSTSLAVASAGFSLGFIDNIIFSAIITLAVVSVFVGPSLVRIFSKNYLKDKN